MISVSSVLRGVPADFASVQTAKSVVVPISNNVERVPYVDSFARNSYYANYELFSTFTPDEYDRLTMRFPSLDDDYHVPGAKDLREYIPYAEFDILFASPNNITGHAMYPAVPILEDKTAEMLREAAEIFARDGYTIKIYDAYRPKSAQFELYDIVQDVRYIANPYTSCSWHQRGRAVDMSLVNTRTGVELEMPTPMHTFDATASRFNSGIWTDAAKANVAYMTDVMTSVGFGTLSTEWWHFENTGTGGYLDVDIDLGDPAYYD